METRASGSGNDGAGDGDQLEDDGLTAPTDHDEPLTRREARRRARRQRREARRTGTAEHGHGHGHAAVSDRAARVSLKDPAARALVLVLAAVAAATLAALVVLWPDGSARSSAVRYSTDGVTFPTGEVVTVHPACPVVVASGAGAATGIDSATGGPMVGPDAYAGQTPPPAGCGTVDVRLSQTSPGASVQGTASVNVPAAVSTTVRPGDTLALMGSPPAPNGVVSYTYLGVQRGLPVTILLVVFLVLLAAVARWRGILAVVGLAFGGFVVLEFMLPALLAGTSGMAVALVGSSVIMFVALYIAHGLSLRTSTALAGTLVGVAITAGLGEWAVTAARLSGVADDESAMLSTLASDINLQGLLTCAVIIAGLGVLNDVTITQTSAVWELRAAAPDASRRELFRRGMRIGRDHIASTVYTIVFAYAGAALPVLLLISLYDRPFGQLLSTEAIGEEVVRTLATSIGLVLAVPVTTAIAVLVATRTGDSARPSTVGPEGEGAPEPSTA